MGRWEDGLTNFNFRLPASVVSVVTTQAFPISMRRANSALRKVSIQKTVSTLIAYSEGKVLDSSPLAIKDVVAVQEAAMEPMNRIVKKRQNGMIFRILRGLKASQPIMILIILVAIILKRNK